MKLCIVLLALAVTPIPASAQQIVFQDGFESGLANWSATGLWGAIDVSAQCSFPAAPFVEGSGAAWYGNPSGCSYGTGRVPNQGALTSNGWIDLPDAPSISLHFWS